MLKMEIIPVEVADFAASAGEVLDFAGILVVLGGFVLSTGVMIYRFLLGSHSGVLYRVYRNTLARSLLLGLEFLVAGDIIRTVAGELSASSVLILSIIVLIRMLLGLEFQLEIDGHWPWQRAHKKSH